jgi:hypothetical protein
MLISDAYSNAGQAAASDLLQPRAGCDPRKLDMGRSGDAGCGGYRNDRLPRAEAIAADWWPLFVAGVAIALLI